MLARYNRECPLIRGLEVTHLTDETCDRPLVESLLDCSTDVSEDTTNDILSIESAHALQAWEEIKPCPTYVLVLRRKRKITKTEEKNLASDTSKPSEEVRVPRLSSPYWKCVDSCYRYVPQNGKFRESKGGTKYADIPRSVRRIVQGRQSITPEQNILHKQIHRELQCELDSQGSTAPPSPRTGPVSAPPGTRNDSVTPRDNITLIAQKYSKDVDDIDRHAQLRSHYREGRSGPPSRRPPPDYYNHARLTRSRESQRRHGSNKSSAQLPPIEVPLLGRTLRTEYMEVFSNRLSALEAEMQKDMLVFRRSHDDSSWGRTTRGERMKFMEFPGYVALSDTEEPFCVKPIKRLKSKKIHNLDYKGMVQVRNSNGEILNVPKYGSSHNNMAKTQANRNVLKNKGSPQSDQALKALRLSEEGFLSSTRVESPTKKPQSQPASASSHRQSGSLPRSKQGSPPVLAPHQVQVIMPESIQTFSVSQQGSAKQPRSIEQESIDPHLPEVAGKRLEVPVASQKAL